MQVDEIVGKKIHASIEALYPKYCDFLSQLVRIPSPYGDEGRAQQFVADKMRQLGLKVDQFEIDPEKLKHCSGYVYDHRNYKGRPLVVGMLSGNGQSRSLALNAHIDTAPLGDREDWLEDPYSGQIRDGKIYGRGAWDDKAGTAIMLLITEAFLQAGISIKGDLILQSVIEDEVSGNGTFACLERGHKSDGAIILDGTWAERIIDAHMGQLWFTVEISGKSAPACVSFRGENPISHLPPILRAFETLAKQKNDQLKNPWGMAQRPIFINVGKINGGSWAGSVPNRCVIECQTGFCPPQTIEEVQEEIQQCLKEAAENDLWLKEHPPKLTFWGLKTNPVVGLKNNPVVEGIYNSIKTLRNKDVQIIPVTGHGDLRHFLNHKPVIPACLYGPGQGANAHVENEYYVIDQMREVAQNIASFISLWWNNSNNAERK